MPPSQIQTPPPGPPVERRAGTRSGGAPRQPRHHSPGSRASGVPARRLLVLLVAVLAQGPVAWWTPELAFAVKRVGSVAISPDGRWAAVEVSEPLMEAEPSEWRTSVYLDRKSTRLNSSHSQISYAVFCLEKKNRAMHADLSGSRP